MSDQELPPFDALLLAAGSGQRFGQHLGRAKQFALLAGHEIWTYSARSLLQTPSLGRLVLVSADGRMPAGPAWLVEDPRLVCIKGGAQRAQSVLAGLEWLDRQAAAAEHVLIHDAARPLLAAAVIQRVLAALASGADAAIPCLPVSDTIRSLLGDNHSQTLDRSQLRAVQTPQGFRRAELVRLHRQNRDPASSDDAQLFDAAGLPVQLVTGDPALMKLTLKSDLEQLERMAAMQMETRSASGFDVHRFADEQADKDGQITLCGVTIAHERTLIAHSDGDVGLHALTDALLACLADGDIGSHFPPSDPKWKSAPSGQFLRFAADRLHAGGGRILNLDVTLACETPKIGPYRDQMRAAIARLASCHISRVSVKATTTEELGFTGRKEGIAAMAHAHVAVPSLPDDPASDGLPADQDAP